MADLSSAHRTALLALVHQDASGRWQRSGDVTSRLIRNRLGWISYSPREVRGLMRRLQQVGLAELARPTPGGSYSLWRITDAGGVALGLEPAHG